MKKQQLADKVVELGIRTVVADRQRKGSDEREQKTYQHHSFHSRGGVHVPTVAQMLLAESSSQC